ILSATVLYQGVSPLLPPVLVLQRLRFGLVVIGKLLLHHHFAYKVSILFVVQVSNSRKVVHDCLVKGLHYALFVKFLWSLTQSPNWVHGQYNRRLILVALHPGANEITL